MPDLHRPAPANTTRHRDRLRRLLRSTRKHPRLCPPGTACDISATELLEQWERQDGRCALSGLRLSRSCRDGPDSCAVGIDRLDRDRGYVPGNVRLVWRPLAVDRATTAGRTIITGSSAYEMVRHPNATADSPPTWEPGVPQLLLALMDAYGERLLGSQLRYMPWHLSYELPIPATGRNCWRLVLETYWMGDRQITGVCLWYVAPFLKLVLKDDKVIAVGDSLVLRSWLLCEPRDLLEEFDRVALGEYRKWCATRLR